MISKIRQDLLALKDEKYLQFNSKIITQKDYPMIGIRLPELRKYAKELMKDNKLVTFKDKYYEEVLLHGLCIGLYKCDFNEKIELIESFLPLINDWSICDSFVPSLKDIKKNKDVYYSYVKKYLKSDKEFYQRFSFVVLLDYYLEDEYYDDICKFIKKEKYNGYYSKMAAAWLLSYMFMLYFDETINYCLNNKLDEFVLNKGIQKAIDSYRLDDKQKNKLRKIRTELKN